jgi:23S rRNA G2445 N2-methylase RlmL
LRDELRELRLPLVRADRGGVHFGEKLEDAYAACLWSRIGLRVHEPLGSFACADEHALYAGVRAIDWSPYVHTSGTVAVRAACQSSRLTHTQYIAQRTKDAIVDQFRDRTGARPNVDRDDADCVVFLHLVNDTATVSLDYSGTSLHQRGIRTDPGPAPIKENLAAALVRFSGWTGETPLLDPMCGSGTLLIEAAEWALRRAPGLRRKRFAFERWPSFDASQGKRWQELRAAAQAAETPRTLELVGADVAASARERARTNASRAGLTLALSEAELGEIPQLGQPATLVTNPPYGERLAQNSSLPRTLDGLLDQAAVASGTWIVPREFPARRAADRWLMVWNGPIACEFRHYAGRAG